MAEPHVVESREDVLRHRIRTLKKSIMSIVAAALEEGNALRTGEPRSIAPASAPAHTTTNNNNNNNINNNSNDVVAECASPTFGSGQPAVLPQYTTMFERLVRRRRESLAKTSDHARAVLYDRSETLSACAPFGNWCRDPTAAATHAARSNIRRKSNSSMNSHALSPAWVADGASPDYRAGSGPGCLLLATEMKDWEAQEALRALKREARRVAGLTVDAAAFACDEAAGYYQVVYVCQHSTEETDSQGDAEAQCIIRPVYATSWGRVTMPALSDSSVSMSEDEDNVGSHDGGVKRVTQREAMLPSFPALGVYRIDAAAAAAAAATRSAQPRAASAPRGPQLPSSAAAAAALSGALSIPPLHSSALGGTAVSEDSGMVREAPFAGTPSLRTLELPFTSKEEREADEDTVMARIQRIEEWQEDRKQEMLQTLNRRRRTSLMGTMQQVPAGGMYYASGMQRRMSSAAASPTLDQVRQNAARRRRASVPAVHSPTFTDATTTTTIVSISTAKPSEEPSASTRDTDDTVSSQTHSTTTTRHTPVRARAAPTTLVLMTPNTASAAPASAVGALINSPIDGGARGEVRASLFSVSDSTASRPNTVTTANGEMVSYRGLEVVVMSHYGSFEGQLSHMGRRYSGDDDNDNDDDDDDVGTPSMKALLAHDSFASHQDYTEATEHSAPVRITL